MFMSTKKQVGLRLKRIRESKGYSQRELASLCGWGASRVGNYESGARSISLDDAETLAKHLGVNAQHILFEAPICEDLHVSNIVPVVGANTEYLSEFPVISSVVAGMWAEAIEPYQVEEIDTYLPTTERVSKRSFWLEVKGDSMTSASGISFPSGTMILVDPELEPESGKLVVAKLLDVNEATFKQLIIDAGQKFLKPLNPAYPIMQINGNCKIIGVVKDAKLKLF